MVKPEERRAEGWKVVCGRGVCWSGSHFFSWVLSTWAALPWVRTGSLAHNFLNIRLGPSPAAVRILHAGVWVPQAAVSGEGCTQERAVPACDKCFLSGCSVVPLVTESLPRPLMGTASLLRSCSGHISAHRPHHSPMTDWERHFV